MTFWPSASDKTRCPPAVKDGQCLICKDIIIDVSLDLVQFNVLRSCLAYFIQKFGQPSLVVQICPFAVPFTQRILRQQQRNRAFGRGKLLGMGACDLFALWGIQDDGSQQTVVGRPWMVRPFVGHRLPVNDTN